jgi:hypothetical protein
MEAKLRHSRKDAAMLLGISTRHLDYRILTGQLKAIRDGSRVYVTPAALKAYASRDHVTERRGTYPVTQIEAN